MELHERFLEDRRVRTLQPGDDCLCLHLPECSAARHRIAQDSGLVPVIRMPREGSQEYLHPHPPIVQPTQTKCRRAGSHRGPIATKLSRNEAQIQTSKRPRNFRSCRCHRNCHSCQTRGFRRISGPNSNCSRDQSFVNRVSEQYTVHWES